MPEYIHKTEKNAGTPDKQTGSRQAPAAEILQAYRETHAIVQREPSADEEEVLQGKFDTAQREALPSEGGVTNLTGMPDNLKNGIESLSGYSMDEVRVHYNSAKPAQLQALAYTQGTDIHVAPGQEKHLPHEAWHVVQQMQGRVQPTVQLQGVNVNDNEGLEREADVMGGKTNNLKCDQQESYQRQNKKFNKSNKLTQLKSYSISKSLLLESRNKTTDSSNQNLSAEYVWKAKLAALRAKYPTSVDDSSDEARGSEFLTEKNKLITELKQDGEFKSENFSINAAHINGATGKRTGIGANKIRKIIPGAKWIGAHLVKDAWGGADNMMNVVAWLDTAEDKWAKEFENPIDNAFTLGGLQTTAQIEVEVTKNDELILPETLSRAYNNNKKDEDPDYNNWLDQEIEKARWNINEAIETVPEKATANYSITNSPENQTGNTTLNSDIIGFNLAKQIATDQINQLAFKQPHSKAIDSAKGKDKNSITNVKSQQRSKARKEAIAEEIKNLKPDTFYIDLEEYNKNDLEALENLGYETQPASKDML